MRYWRTRLGTIGIGFLAVFLIHNSVVLAEEEDTQLNWSQDFRCGDMVNAFTVPYLVMGTDQMTHLFQLDWVSVGSYDGMNAWLSPFLPPFKVEGYKTWQWMQPAVKWSCFFNRWSGDTYAKPTQNNLGSAYSGWAALVQDKTPLKLADAGGTSGPSGGSNTETWCLYEVNYNPMTGVVNWIVVLECWEQ